MNLFVIFFIACGQEVENRGGSSLLANGYRSDLLKVIVGSKEVSILYNSDWKLLVKTEVVLQVTYWYGSSVLLRFFDPVGHKTTYDLIIMNLVEISIFFNKWCHRQQWKMTLRWLMLTLFISNRSIRGFMSNSIKKS